MASKPVFKVVKGILEGPDALKVAIRTIWTEATPVSENYRLIPFDNCLSDGRSVLGALFTVEESGDRITGGGNVGHASGFNSAETIEFASIHGSVTIKGAYLTSPADAADFKAHGTTKDKVAAAKVIADAKRKASKNGGSAGRTFKRG